MRRLLVVVGVLCLAVGSGCSPDTNSPKHWERVLAKTRKPSDKARVIDSLRDTPGRLTPAFLPMMHELLAESKNGEVKAAAARTVAALKDPSSVEPLMNAVDLTETELGANLANKEIATALAQLGDPRALPTLLKLAGTRDSYTRVEAVQALGTLRSKDAVEPLMAMAEDDKAEPFLSRKALEALGRIGDPRAVPTLVRMLTKERRGNSFYPESSFALFQMGPAAADALLPALEGKDAALATWAQKSRVRPEAYYFKAAQVLGDLREPRAEPVLVQRLGFTNPDPQIQAVVRMYAADALGRMRAASAAKPLTAMVGETDPDVRDYYVRALVNLGGRDALPALLKAAETGDYFARIVAAEGVANLGDAREKPALQKWVDAEVKRTTDECAKLGYQGCDDAPALAKKHQAAFAALMPRLDAGQACGQDAACWAGKLQEKDNGVVARAALELGRQGAGAAPHVEALAAHLAIRNATTRAAVVQATTWVVGASPEAARKLKPRVPALEKQLADERGTTSYARVNEELRRLVARLQRAEG